MANLKAAPVKDGENEGEVFGSVAFYSLNILITPLISFFICKVVLLEGILSVDSTTSNIWSAVLAVVVLHLMLALYLYRTFYPAKQGKQD